MSTAQVVFLSAFGLVNLVVLGTVLLVLLEARRVDGGGHWNSTMLSRLGRLPTERSEANRMAFYAHRLSGIGIFTFLCLHVVDVSLYGVSPDLYDNVHELYGTPVMRLFECVLLAALLFHALNGLRLVLIDLCDLGALGAIRLLTGVTVLTGLGTLLGSIVILRPVFS